MQYQFDRSFDHRMKWTLRIACAVLIGLGIAVIAVFGQSKPTTLFHTFKLSDSEVGVNCRNGGSPAVKTLGNLVVVSCVR